MAVRTERHAPDLKLMSPDHTDDGPRTSIAHLHCVLRPFPDEEPARWVKSHEKWDTSAFPHLVENRSAGRRFKDTDECLALRGGGCGGDLLAIGAETQVKEVHDVGRQGDCAH